MKIRTQLLLVYLAAGTIPLLLLSVSLVNNTTRLAADERAAQAAADNRRVKVIVFAATYLATNVSETVFYDPRLRALAERRYADDSRAYAAYRDYTLLDAYLANYTEISGISLYVRNPTMPSSNRFRRVTAEVEQSRWYRAARASAGEILWVVDAEPGRPTGLRLLRKIPLSGPDGFAVLVITVSGNHLKLMFDDSSLRTMAALDGGGVFFSADAADIGRPLPVAADGPPRARTGTARLGGRDVLYAASAQEAVKATAAFRVLTIDPAAPADTRRTMLAMALLAAVSMAVPYGVIGVFLGVFGRRIGTLRREMHKVAGGDFNVVDALEGRDELSDVFSDMRVMVGSIQELTREVYREKLSQERLAARQQRIELKVLASQINPHFLFNTLETIRMKAHLNGDAEVARLTRLLGSSIRRVLEVGSAPVTLASELEHIRVYLEIQAARFSDRISCGIDVAADVDAERYRILPLLIQPVVENAIVHGLEPKAGPGRVLVDIRRADGRLVVTVTDDGVGIAEERRAALLRALRSPESAHPPDGIGLANVNQRIRLCYGEDFGLAVESRPGGGTVARLVLPAEGKEADPGDGPDR
jgi:two-component system, sensor histidine kinase YesM